MVNKMQNDKIITNYENYRENKSHGEHSYPFSIYSCVIPDLFSEVLPHWHEEMEIILIKEGKGIVSVDFEKRVLTAPAIMFILPGQLHGICQYEKERMEYENIIFHPRLLQSHDNDIFDQQYLTPLLDGMIQMPTFLEEVDTGFSLLYAPLKECEETDSPLMVKSLLFLLCSRLLELYPERTERAARRDALERVKPVLVYVQDHYQEVITPHIGSKNLYVTSGHWDHYGKDSFQPITTPEEGEVYMLKPMNCPHHCEIFAWKPRSYRDLPLRIAEFGTVYRYEQSGELHGFTRVRSFTQDDAHIFCRPDQVKQEFLNVMDIISVVLTAFGFNFEAQISLRDPNDHEKYVGSDEDWDLAEKAIVEACEEKGLPAKKEYGEAAFYGPKLDFMIKDAIGRRWQLGTIQVDYNLPKRFQLEYTDEDNQKKTPVMIHRAPFGSLERFTAVLIEHTSGHFPLWLTPEQVVVLPLSEKYNDYAFQVQKQLDQAGVRAQVDDRNEKLGRKIRDNELKRIPFMLIVGEKEAAEGLVSMRQQGGGEQATMTIAEFAKKINDEVAEMTKDF